MKKNSFATTFLLQNMICANLSCHVSVEQNKNEIISSTDSQLYDDDFIQLIELVYGEGLLSQGGEASINEMFHGINLNNLKMLDLGSGLGMYDIYLSKNNNVDIIGIDPQMSLIEKANQNLAKSSKDLQGSLSFQLMKDPNNLKQFSDNSFDIVFSKEAILHVPNACKESYFKEIYRVLKPGGKIIIMDWMHSSLNYSTSTKKMMEMDNLSFHLLTPSEYRYTLKKAGFVDIKLLDTTEEHTRLSQQNIDTIITLEDQITNKFGKDVYLYSLESWTYQRDAFKNRELLTGILTADKFK